MHKLRCPTCDREFDPGTFPFGPFCSERCQRVDLGRWLRETYAVPVMKSPDEDYDEMPTGPVRSDDE